MAQSVTRALQTIKRYGVRPEQLDHAILSAINVTLCLSSGGDDRVAEGFNHDIATSGRSSPTFPFGWMDKRHWVLRAAAELLRPAALVHG